MADARPERTQKRIVCDSYYFGQVGPRKDLVWLFNPQVFKHGKYEANGQITRSVSVSTPSGSCLRAKSLSAHAPSSTAKSSHERKLFLSKMFTSYVEKLRRAAALSLFVCQLAKPAISEAACSAFERLRLTRFACSAAHKRFASIFGFSSLGEGSAPNYIARGLSCEAWHSGLYEHPQGFCLCFRV
jgi:hypothetical protein